MFYEIETKQQIFFMKCLLFSQKLSLLLYEFDSNSEVQAEQNYNMRTKFKVQYEFKVCRCGALQVGSVNGSKRNMNDLSVH